jgi:mannose PTS system EIIA component
MSVGILLLTHEGIGDSIQRAAEQIFGTMPLKVIAHSPVADADQRLAQASAALRKVESEDGVLVLTDLHGALPAQLARQISQLGTPVRRVSGLNLPMLLRVLNYAEQNLDDLARTAAAGGRNAVSLDDA